MRRSAYIAALKEADGLTDFIPTLRTYFGDSFSPRINAFHHITGRARKDDHLFDGEFVDVYQAKQALLMPPKEENIEDTDSKDKTVIRAGIIQVLEIHSSTVARIARWFSRGETPTKAMRDAVLEQMKILRSEGLVQLNPPNRYFLTPAGCKIAHQTDGPKLKM